MITVEKIRPDGRKLDEVRPISCRTGVLPRTHGSGLFTRGQTQVLNVATVAPLSENKLSMASGLETEKRYIHHYNFPSFSVGKLVPPAVLDVVKSVMVLWLNAHWYL